MTVIGSSLDDAAGEAFDKGARLLGLGYPGGAALEQLAVGRRRQLRTRFPAAMVGRPGHDFSFSGLKTALARAVRDGAGTPADLAASYQAAIVRALVERAAEAVEATGAGTLAVVGGVARNSAPCATRAARRCRELGVAAGPGAARALLRQRGHDRVGGPVHHAARRSRTTCPATPTRRPHERRGAHDDGRRLPPVRRGLRRCSRQARAELGFDLVEVDITGDPDLEAEYREQIPVVFVAGRKAFKYRVDPAELRRRVAAATSAA